MGVIRGIFNNGLANIAQKIVRILDQLLLVPFFLTAWGAEYYGEWLTLTIIPSILSFSDLGFGSAVGNSFVLAYAKGEKQQAANLYKSGILIISATVLLGVLVSLIIVLVGIALGVFEKTVIPANDVLIAVSFMMTSRLISFYIQFADAFYRSVRRAATSNFLMSGNSLISIFVGMLILYAGYGIVGLSLSYLIISLFYTLFFWFYGRSFISFDDLKGVVLKEDIHQIIIKGIGYLSNPIWQSIYFQGTTFVVRVAVGAEGVAVFNTVRTVCRSINQFFSIINSSIFPELQYEYGRGNYALVKRLYRIAVLISISVGFIGVLILCLFGLVLYNWWTQTTLVITSSLWYMFMVGAFMNAVWWTSAVAYRMTNQPQHYAIASTLTAFISVVLCYILSDIYGLVGSAFATVVFEFIMAIYILPDSCRLLNLRVSDLFMHIPEDFRVIKRAIFNRK